MTKVAVTKSKLDALAEKIGIKSKRRLPLTIDEMGEAVDSIELYVEPEPPKLQAKTRAITEAGTFTDTPDSGYDGLSSVTTTVPQGAVAVHKNSEYLTQSGNRKWRYRGTAYIETVDGDGTPGFIEDGSSFAGSWITHNAIASGTSVTPTESTQTIGGSNYMMEGAVTVAAIPSNYVGSGITQRSSSDLTASGATVTAPTGYYSSAATKTIVSGTEGTPTITVGNLYRGERTIQASVTNTEGYISGGTQNASLVVLSGYDFVVPGSSYEITENDTYEGLFSEEIVVNVPTGTARSSSDLTVSGATVTVPAGLYSSNASASVASGTEGTPTASKGTVSNHQVSVTPSVTNSAGYISGGTKTGTAVTVSASELVSGTLNIVSAGENDVTNYATVNVSSTTLPTTADSSPASGYSQLANFLPSSSDRYINIARGFNGTSQYYKINAVPDGSVTASATKGSVSNHAISVTPTATVGTAGYLAAGNTNGTAVSVSASELVSGTYTVDSSGTKDVTNYASASIAAGSATASATKGSVSNHAISVTPSVTRTAGWVTAGSANGTAVSVSASELVSGTYSVTSSGTKDVTNYASASVPAMTLPSSTSSSSSGTKKTNIYPEQEAQYLNIPTGYNDTAQYYEIMSAVLGTKTITSNGTYEAEYDDLYGYSSVTVNVSGGGGSDVAVDVVGGASTSTSISFSNLKGEPTSFSLMADNQIATGTPAKVAAVVFDGTDLHVQTITNTSNAQVTYVSSGFTKSYSNGTLTVSNSSASFAGDYYLVYTYDGGAGNIQTSDVQVGSGATSITFADLEDEPLCWYLIFKSDFGTSSGYQRVIFARYDGDITEGMEMDSAAKPSSTHWSSTYNSGTLTITSQGTNQGGYFHQPGYYQLTYAIAGGGGNYQSKTVTPTTSQQVVQADSGYDALKKVTVEAIPNTYVQPTSTVGATTYRASTSNQTINAGTYHSAAATIAAVSQTNLSAENIKSGTTISISNGQSNLWSVTGTYTGGGGGSASIDTKTVTSSNRPTSLSFTSMLGQPKAFFLRCTSSMSRSSNSTYYYVADMRYNGTNTTGNCWRMSNGNWTNITSGYSYTYSGTTLTVSSSGSTTASPGCFYPGNYELVYVY